MLEILRRAADPSLLQAPLGRFGVDGDRLYFLLAEYDTQPPSGSFPETHREYCDVQIVLRGEERIGWAPLSAAWAPSSPYEPGRDIQHYVAGSELSWLVARPGLFFFFEPNDVHQPGLVAGTPVRVRKMVGKVHRTLVGIEAP